MHNKNIDLKNNIKSFHRFLNENVEEKNLLNETIIRILTSQFKIIQNNFLLYRLNKFRKKY